MPRRDVLGQEILEMCHFYQLHIYQTNNNPCRHSCISNMNEWIATIAKSIMNSFKLPATYDFSRRTI